jgi:hypothetical protein
MIPASGQLYTLPLLTELLRTTLGSGAANYGAVSAQCGMTPNCFPLQRRRRSPILKPPLVFKLLFANSH